MPLLLTCFFHRHFVDLLKWPVVDIEWCVTASSSPFQEPQISRATQNRNGPLKYPTSPFNRRKQVAREDERKHDYE